MFKYYKENLPLAQKQKAALFHKISKREQERIAERKAGEKTSFSTIAMRVFIVIVLVAMIMGLAIQIIAYN